MRGRSGVARELPDHRVLGNARIDGGSKVGIAGCIGIGGGRLREWEYTCSGLVSFFRIALGGVEFSIRSEDADVIQVLVAGVWWSSRSM